LRRSLPAREDPIPGVSTDMILQLMKLENKVLIDKKQVPAMLRERETEIVITMGAGDIDGIAGEIIDILKNKN
jgi:UDP-N-acetylmuramate--alanine ligase